MMTNDEMSWYPSRPHLCFSFQDQGSKQSKKKASPSGTVESAERPPEEGKGSPKHVPWRFAWRLEETLPFRNQI
jgi:hypothetical protein